jgi:hypothetical protein
VILVGTVIALLTPRVAIMLPEGGACMRHHDETKPHNDPSLLKNDTRGTDSNPDPITGAPGSHPVGTGVGAAGGGAAGAAIGAVAGPAGALIGGAVGAVVGGLAGKGVAEKIDPTVEDAYWRQNYKTRPYVGADESYDTYQPAYRYGWESRNLHGNRSWDEVEGDLGRDWNNRRGTSGLQWDRAKLATKDAWHRVETALPGDADRDGR